MTSETEIINLANNKLKVAEFLLSNGFYDDAYYLGGYSLELFLKAKICKTLLIPDFFDFDNSKNRKIPIAKTRRGEKENLYKPYKVHDYEQLIILSGLYSVFSNELSVLSFSADWSVVSKWDENFRYSNTITSKDAKSFIESLKNIIKWLSQYL